MYRTLPFLLMLLISCAQGREQKGIQLTPVTVKKQKEEKKDYLTVLSAAKSFKQKSIDSDSFEIIYGRFIVDSIIPFWYGTKWNFYGNTQEPQKGSIACGYFVTTVLRDAGLHINRVKLAQVPSEEMIKSICNRNSIKRFSNTVMPAFINELLQSENGLYIVGLDFHTGFIYHNNRELYFIHASYQMPQVVIKQNATESSILSSSKYKVIGKVNLQL
ncbi:hypothetical protein ESA94_16785 [Lacibacter luteus]|uniref:Uncharacterized protein n=1 Tax=Lacibacter luteus TaxID=2508719 RepID=A0A4Q1CF66_9BACT|nr:hypothetical protein [Lacibacter luteus]RXK58302.1 hypothetical protein ESA94_16785 [Lacibacter luteus]